MTRAGCPGVQRYAQSWSGDNTTSWETLRWNLRTGLQMALSGIVNTGHDIGGFAGPVPDAELLIRWTQTGVVHPRFIMNSWKPDGVINSPWLHETALPAIREAIRLRYRLIPYLYSLLHETVACGAPVLQPTFLAFEDDPRCVADSDVLMLGPFLLAVPVVAPGERTVRAYLPAGPECWFDFATGEQLGSGYDVEVAAPLERLPLLVPAGAILPMTDGDTGRLHDEPSRCVHVFPGFGSGESVFTLVEDDGFTADGPVSRLRLVLAWDGEDVRLRVSGDGAAYAGRIRAALRQGDGRTLTISSEPGAPAVTV